MALSFDAIIQCFISLFGLAGEGIAIILLILQLCSDSGTFPIEVLPKFFQTINPYLPFTYCVEVLREILFSANVNSALLQKDAFIILLFGLVFILLNMIFIKKGQVITQILEKKLA